jgi:hypothetical protein
MIEAPDFLSDSPATGQIMRYAVAHDFEKHARYALQLMALTIVRTSEPIGAPKSRTNYLDEARRALRKKRLLEGSKPAALPPGDAMWHDAALSSLAEILTVLICKGLRWVTLSA